MAEVFTLNDEAIRAQKPNLVGDYTPGLDNSVLDGRKLIVPWGAGDNQKRYLTGMDAMYTPDGAGSGELYNGITLADLIQLNQQGLLGKDGQDGYDGRDGRDGLTRLINLSSYASALAAAGGFSLGLPGPAGPAGAAGGTAAYIQVETEGFIFLHPTGEAVTPDTIELSSQLFNVAAPTYQWSYWNGAIWEDIVGATSSTYTVDNEDFTDERTYQLTATSGGTDYIDRVTLAHLYDGADSTVYYIKATAGTAIKNGTGTLTIEAHAIVAGEDSILSAGTIMLFDPSNNDVHTDHGYQTGSDGYTGVLDTTNINGNIVITLKDGVGGTVLDTITLIDVDDGEDSIFGSVDSNNGLAFVQAPNGGSWAPVGGTTDLTVTYYQSGGAIGDRTVRVTNSPGTLSAPASGGADGDGIDYTVIGGGTAALTIEFEHVASGIKVSETIYAVEGGDQGDPGADGDDGADGVDSYTALLTNESHTVACDVVGTAKTGELGEGNRATCDVLCFRGTTPLTGVTGTPGAGEFSISLADTNCTSGQPAADYDTFFISAMSADTAEVTVTINLEDLVTITKVMTLSKAYDGQTLTADIPLLNGVTWGSSGSNVTWNEFTILYKGTQYTVAADGVGTADKYIYWDQSVGTSLSSSDTFGDAVGNNKWLLGENDSGTMYESVVAKYIMAGYIRAATLSAISAVLGDLEIQNSGDGSLTIVGMDGDADKAIKINEDGIYSTLNYTAGSPTWKQVIGLKDDGKITVGFAAYASGETIGDAGTLQIVEDGAISIGSDATATDTWGTGPVIPYNQNYYSTPTYSSVNGGKIFISSEQTMEHSDQYGYWHDASADLFQFCKRDSGATATGNMRIYFKPFVVLENNSVDYGSEYSVTMSTNTSGHANRASLPHWVDYGSDVAYKISSFHGGLTPGTKFKTGWVFHVDTTYNTPYNGTWRGTLKLDQVTTGSLLVKP